MESGLRVVKGLSTLGLSLGWSLGLGTCWGLGLGLQALGPARAWASWAWACLGTCSGSGLGLGFLRHLLRLGLGLGLALAPAPARPRAQTRAWALAWACLGLLRHPLRLGLGLAIYPRSGYGSPYYTARLNLLRDTRSPSQTKCDYSPAPPSHAGDAHLRSDPTAHVPEALAAPPQRCLFSMRRMRSSTIASSRIPWDPLVRSYPLARMPDPNTGTAWLSTETPHAGVTARHMTAHLDDRRLVWRGSGCGPTGTSAWYSPSSCSSIHVSPSTTSRVPRPLTCARPSDKKWAFSTYTTTA